MSTIKRAAIFLFPYMILAVCILEEYWRRQAASMMQYDTYTDMLTITAGICTIFLFFYIRWICIQGDGILLILNSIAVLLYSVLIWLPGIILSISPVIISGFQNEQLLLMVTYGLLLIGEGYQLYFFVQQKDGIQRNEMHKKDRIQKF